MLITSKIDVHKLTKILNVLNTINRNYKGVIMLIISHDSLNTIFIEYPDGISAESFIGKKVIPFKQPDGTINEEIFTIECYLANKVSVQVFENKTLTPEKLQQIIGETDKDIVSLIYKEGIIPKKNIIIPQYKNPASSHVTEKSN